MTWLFYLLGGICVAGVVLALTIWGSQPPKGERLDDDEDLYARVDRRGKSPRFGTAGKDKG
jgi:hypothetical protein